MEHNTSLDEGINFSKPPVVSAAEWETALAAMLVKEKEHTRAGDQLASGSPAHAVAVRRQAVHL